MKHFTTTSSPYERNITPWSIRKLCIMGHTTFNKAQLNVNRVGKQKVVVLSNDLETQFLYLGYRKSLHKWRHHSVFNFEILWWTVNLWHNGWHSVYVVNVIYKTGNTTTSWRRKPTYIHLTTVNSVGWTNLLKVQKESNIIPEWCMFL